MRRVLVVAALCAASGAWADTQGVLGGPSFSVDYSAYVAWVCNTTVCDHEPPPQIDGNTILWPINYSMTTRVRGQPMGDVDATFNFLPSAGFAITGYEVQFSLSFFGLAYTYTGNEINSPLPAGTIKSSSADFSTQGRIEHLDYSNTSATVVERFNADAPLHFDARLTFNPYYLPCQLPDQSGCSLGWPDGPLYATVAIREIRIAPTVVAVPEPSTYVLLAAGLLAICIARRRDRLLRCPA